MTRSWTAYAPWPFVGAAVLLVILILLTPILISTTSHPAPGVLTEAILVVDRVPGENTTQFYVVAYGEAIRYAGIWVGVAENFSWAGAGSPDWAGLQWTEYHNASDVVALPFNSSGNPVAVNVTAYYVSSSGNAVYGGELAFYVGSTSSGPSIYAATATPGVFVPTLTPVNNASLPFYIILTSVPMGSVP